MKIPAVTITDDEKESVRDEKNVGKYGPVAPLSDMKVVKGEEICFWNKPLQQSLSSALSLRLFSNNKSNYDSDKGIDSVDLVIGGDHGQRKFRMMMKVIIRKLDMKKMDEFVLKIGHVDCKKRNLPYFENNSNSIPE